MELRGGAQNCGSDCVPDAAARVDPSDLRRGSYAVAICHKPPAKYGGILEDFPLRSAGDCIREKTKHRPEDQMHVREVP